jgi:hypothetical protein
MTNYLSMLFLPPNFSLSLPIEQGIDPVGPAVKVKCNEKEIRELSLLLCGEHEDQELFSQTFQSSPFVVFVFSLTPKINPVLFFEKVRNNVSNPEHVWTLKSDPKDVARAVELIRPKAQAIGYSEMHVMHGVMSFMLGTCSANTYQATVNA